MLIGWVGVWEQKPGLDNLSLGLFNFYKKNNKEWSVIFFGWEFAKLDPIGISLSHAVSC